MTTTHFPAAAPFPLGRLQLANRIVGTPHGTGMVSDGIPQPGDADYWRRRAAGGPAMLTVGGTLVAPESTSRNGIATEAWRPEAQPGIAARAEAIRSEGVVAACQIVHLGRETLLAETWFHPVGPSAVRSPREPTRPRPLTDGEVDDVVEGFVTCAVNVHEAGFQVVELHAAHGYLLAQFLSAFPNRRPGAETIAGRVEVFARIVDEIRSAIPEAVVGVRLSTEGGEEAGFTIDGLCELLSHVSPLVDYVNLTVGVRTTYVKDMGTPDPPLLPHVARVRALVDKPLLISHQFRRGADIARALAEGADLVGVARPLIADPDMPAKLLAGRESSIRPCVACVEDCRAFDPVLLCSVNPDLARPGEEHRPAAPYVAQRGDGSAGGPVAIVGAGPAGLECALRLAGERDVVVFDERDVIGGELAVATAAPNRPGWGWLLDFYRAELDAAGGVELRLGTRAGARDLEGFGDVVLAVGSTEVLPDVAAGGRALTASAAIAAGADALAGGRHLLVVDDGFGWWYFASAVELGVAAGFASITAVTPAAAFGGSLPAEARVQLVGRLRGAPVTVQTFTALDSVREGAATLRNTVASTTDDVPADTVIVVGERRARDWSDLVPAGANVQVIGDALVPRRVAHAVSEGRAAAEAVTTSRAVDGVVG
jgi:2,4-dienoyl-CoA reductase-like NADH-dependent reductase (Old Yellow Enzyme family)/threonine dehydrogenase-like Zn-dependent dehydrogenase